MIFNQRSFSRGILSPNAITRENIPGYAEAVRDMNNFLIGRTGEAYRRGGTTILERADNPIERIIPFQINDNSYVLIFERFENNLIINSNPRALGDYIAIKVLNLTNKTLSINDIGNLSLADFQNAVPVKIYGSNNQVLSAFDSYYRDPALKFLSGELASSSYAQLGNLIVMVNENQPPFAIRKEGNDFVFYRNLMDMVLNGDGEDDVINALSVFPYSFYGYGLDPRYIEETATENGSHRFIGLLELNNNHDKAGLSDKNREFWENRLFICSLARQNTEEVIVFGGIIRKLYKRGTSKNRFRIVGELFFDDISSLQETNINRSLSNLYICDWSERIGWPRSVSLFENRFIYGGNEAYPSKIWFSSQPSVQRVPFGNEVTVTQNSETQEEIRTEKPIYKTVYYDQLDLFNKDQEALGLIVQNTASAGSYFINNPKGISIYWIIGGEVLYIGTNLGVFFSKGTDAGSAAPIPFNTGFPQIDHIPCRRVFPIVVARTLFFITRDNSVRMLRFAESGGYEGKNIDSFSKEVIKDTSVVSFISRQVRTHSLTDNSEDLVDNSALYKGPVSLDLGFTDLYTKRKIDDTLMQVHFNKVFSYQDDEVILTADNLIENDTNVNINNPNKFLTDALFSVDIAAGFPTNVGGLDKAEIKEVYDNRIKKETDLSNFSPYSFLIGVVLDVHFTYKKSGTDWNLVGEDRHLKLVYAYTPSLEIKTLNKVNTLKGGFREFSVIPENLNVMDNSNLLSGFTSGFLTSAIIGSCKDNPTLIKGKNPYDYVIVKEIQQFQVVRNGITYYNTKVILDSDAIPEIVDEIRLHNAATGQLIGDTFATFRKSDIQKSNGEIFLLHESTESTDIVPDANSLQVETYALKGGVVVPPAPTHRFLAGFDVGTASYNDADDATLRGFKNTTKNKYTGLFNVREVDLINNSFQYTTPYHKIFPTAATEEEMIGYHYQDLSLIEKGLLPSSYSFDIALDETKQINAENNKFATTILPVVTTNKNYKSFKDDTRLFYDWVKQILFIFRPDKRGVSNYLGFTWEEESGVTAWQRGSVGFEDIAYLPQIKLNLPIQFPFLLGVKGNNVVIKTEGLFNADQGYLPTFAERFLPNCLDDHIVFEKVGGSVPLVEVKSLLKSLGYTDDDKVMLASDEIVHFNDIVGNLTTDLDTSKSKFIVGKSFISSLVSWPPLMNTRKGSLRGQKYSIDTLMLYLLLGSVKGKKGPEFQVNGAPIQILPHANQPTYIDTIEIYEYHIETGKDFDPQFELLVNNPFPLAFTGFDLNIKAEK